MSEQEAREKEKKVAYAHEQFCRLVSLKYTQRCKLKDAQPTMEGLIEYMIKEDILRSQEVIHQLIIDLYPVAMYNNNGSRRMAVSELEDILPVADRTIWRTLKRRK